MFNFTYGLQWLSFYILWGCFVVFREGSDLLYIFICWVWTKMFNFTYGQQWLSFSFYILCVFFVFKGLDKDV